VGGAISSKRVFAALVLGLVAAGFLSYLFRSHLTPVVGRAINQLRSWNAPPGTLVVEAAQSAGSAQSLAAPPSSTLPLPAATSSDWPSYNRTLTSERYSPLDRINRSNVAGLSVLCTYDTLDYSSFQTGPLILEGALIGTTEQDIFSIDPATCKQRWRTHEELKHTSVSRGAAYLDGLLYRGTGDGRVIAYDFKTGAKVWESTIADSGAGESASAAPIAWNGLIFIGNAGGDNKGVKGRMYALEAKTGKIVWEFYLVPRGPRDPVRGPQGASPLDTSTWGNQPGIPITGGATWTSYTLDPESGELYVPAGNAAPDFAPGERRGANLYSGSVVVLDAKTGAYKRHFQLTSGDWHDYDVSNTPALLRTRNGKRLLAVAPKDGYLYGIDMDSGALLYRTAATRIENADAPLSNERPVRFCPGTRGGAEWNGPAYDPQSNLIFIGEVDWCSTIRLQTDAQIEAARPGRVWAGMASYNPYDIFGRHDPYPQWAGWIYATDADTGAWRWRAKSNYPIQSGITPTAGGVVFFGDMGGNFYALDAATGRRLWGSNLGGAVGGGVVSYSADGAQKVAVAVGFTSVLWPTKVVTGKIVILGLPER
jgi:alcohol dehydrogenase (cytochrome c)